VQYQKIISIFERSYNHQSKTGNSDQRNFYLDCLKKIFPDEWVLCLDADEILERNLTIPPQDPKVYQLRMRHLQGDFGHEDSTQPIHFVLNRFFHMSNASHYPEGEHPVLQSVDGKYFETNKVTIWHLAYAPNMWYIKDRYDNHMAKSQIHSKEFLRTWYLAHLFGRYFKKEINPVELPTVLLNNFGIEKDELYFASRGIEPKHWSDSLHWKHFFKPKTVLEFGAGLGPRTLTMNELGMNAMGVELSQYAVDHQFENANVVQGDVLDWKGEKADLVVAYDILEHLEYGDLRKAIENLKAHTNKYVLVSVPVIGDPNLANDSTHKIFQTMEWWKETFTQYGFKEVEVPAHFNYRAQTFIMEVINGNA